MAKIEPCVVGTTAPQFTLDAVASNLKPIRIGIDDYQDRWVMLIFYPRDFSFVCPTELTGFSAEKEQFEKLNCDIIGISIDTIDSHTKWLTTTEEDGGVQGLRFPLASDIDGKVCKEFGVWREADQLPNRGLFLIDPSWTLRYAVTHDLSVGRNVNDVLQTLIALNSGGLCPSNWKRADGVLDVASMLNPGRVLGNYRIVRELGKGGFGQVLEAVDLRLQRKVALKIISDQSASAEESLLTEARLAAGINHPNVCTIYAADSIDTLPVIAMEFVEGGTLGEAIVNGITHQEFHQLACDIASGLAAAHRQQIVHGDLKPANILLDSMGKPVIADFGLARAMSQREIPRAPSEKPSSDFDQQTSDSIPQDSLAMEETMVFENGAGNLEDIRSEIGGHQFITGTPAYMSPEQAFGDPLNEFSDVFSLGLILAQMFSGQSLYGDLLPLEIVKSLRKREFVESLPDKIPELKRNEIADMLSADPQNRPSADEVCQRFGIEQKN